MVYIDDKALEYAKKNRGGFLVRTISASSGCCSMEVKEISVEFIKKFPEVYTGYKLESYKGINVFIENGLEFEDKITIYQKIKLPLLGTVFGAKGVSVKYL
ncbi:MAG: hypothetical protein LKE46_06395 [Clostridium sp.]|jgi:hypothetical protein|uniref:hypothetical protein n=1 Tax=Clostridium sp. TaxID=1506 RepID=UPI0025C3FD9F|nr:hypothetical protein [Clostridium sp.]MCH3963887.1 hypothetical protein [Clostridium sp.]MCI1717006.1 hypothetical protein [Clostridium sp.]MCI1801275.1 hypothetical protein [Clostridium sp.]MCI1815121.1 hypothetical protein [Clostridium sp.]MCI1872095.1 hypothetical protein [Clostridium sp.]